MAEWRELPDGGFALVEHNCPVDCAAREYRQACTHELTLYEDILGVPLVREETISEGFNVQCHSFCSVGLFVLLRNQIPPPKRWENSS